MEFTATDALDRYKPLYKKRDKYILKFLNKEIEKVKEKQLFLELPVYFDLVKGDKSLIFDKKLLLGHIDFELSDVIFKTLENNGYSLEFEKLDKFTDYYKSGKFIGVYQSGIVKILWDKYYVKWENSYNKISSICYYLIDPISVRSSYKNYDAIAEQYISEMIEPKIKEALYTKTYIVLPANVNENSLIFTDDYSQFEANDKLTNAIIKILTENGFSCEFERSDESVNDYLFIKWFHPVQ